MIQRIQSIYLLLAIAALVATFFFPFANIGTALEYSSAGLRTMSNFEPQPSLLPFPPSYVVIGIICLLVFTLLQFKARKRQLLLTKFNYLLTLGLIVMIYLTIGDAVGDRTPEAAGVVYSVSTYLPVVALVFLFLAHRAIKKDEALIDSLDRLR